ITLGAQLAVTPLILVNFHQISLIAIGANLVAMPAVAPATVGGMAAAGLGALWRPLSAVALFTGPPIAWMQWVAHALAQLPLASVATPAGALGLLLAAALTAGALAAARGKRPKRAAPIILSIALLMTGGAWARALGPAPLLLRGLSAQGVHRIDLLVISHPHADHVDGLVPVAETFPVGRALDPYTPADLPAYKQIVDTLAARRIARDRAVAGMTYGLGDA